MIVETMRPGTFEGMILFEPVIINPAMNENKAHRHKTIIAIRP